MSNLKSILSSFHLKDKLNPKIWVLPNERAMSDPKGQMETMRPKVRERLIDIADEFIDFLGVDVIVSDVMMTGSLANYNWSQFSDIDLHIIVDFEQFSDRELPLYEELFKLKKTLFNDKHDIKIYGYDVELYVQNDVEVHFSSGEYSVLFDEWKNKPKKEKVKIDTELIQNKSKHWMKIIDEVIDNSDEKSLVSLFIKASALSCWFKVNCLLSGALPSRSGEIYSILSFVGLTGRTSKDSMVFSVEPGCFNKVKRFSSIILMAIILPICPSALCSP